MIWGGRGEEEFGQDERDLYDSDLDADLCAAHKLLGRMKCKIKNEYRLAGGMGGMGLG